MKDADSDGLAFLCPNRTAAAEGRGTASCGTQKAFRSPAEKLPTRVLRGGLAAIYIAQRHGHGQLKVSHLGPIENLEWLGGDADASLKRAIHDTNQHDHHAQKERKDASEE